MSASGDNKLVIVSERPVGASTSRPATAANQSTSQLVRSLQALPAPPTVLPLDEKEPVEELVSALGALYTAVLGVDESNESKNARLSEMVDALMRLGLPGMEELVEKQRKLGRGVISLEDETRRGLIDVQRRLKAARASSLVLKRTERLKITVADIHDSFEDTMQQANRLASRFYRPEEELYSFQNFLKTQPPVITNQQRSLRGR